MLLNNKGFCTFPSIVNLINENLYLSLFVQLNKNDNDDSKRKPNPCKGFSPQSFKLLHPLTVKSDFYNVNVTKRH